MKELMEYYDELIQVANKRNLQRFMFCLANKYYLVEWYKNRWSDAMEIEMLEKPIIAASINGTLGIANNTEIIDDDYYKKNSISNVSGVGIQKP